MLTSFYNSSKELLIYLPLSIIGLWRWSYWLVRKVAATLYSPEFTQWPEDQKKPTVTVITPVYNEDPNVFEQAMQSWISNGVTEIIAVIDKSNVHQIIDYDKRYVHRRDVRCRLVVTPKPGKRAALCDGIVRSNGDLIALVDSDTIWGDEVLAKALPYFLNERIGGATVSQRIQNPDSVSNVMFDILLWTRYHEEVPFLLGLGKAFNTLSGRTAFYRRGALLNDNHDNIHLLRHEHFLGTRGVSGDDKRLTHLILEQGWHVSYVVGAEVYTPGLSSTRSFLKQRLRWTRNSWRADLRAIKRGWAWRHPVLAFFMIDRFFQPFFMLIGPFIFVLAVSAGDWLTAGILIGWWLASRFVRLASYFKAYPKRIVYLPAYVIYGYTNALMKIYALATLMEHTWATRWHKQRLKYKTNWRKTVPIISGSLALAVFLTGIFWFVHRTNNTSGAHLKVPAAVSAGEFDGLLLGSNSAAPASPKPPDNMILPTGVKVYTVKPGDSLIGLSETFQMTVTDIKRLNGLRDPDILHVGQKLIYYDPAARKITQ